MLVKLNYLLLLFCIYSTNSIANNAIDDDVPNFLKKLQQISNKDSIEYEIESYKAAIDSINAGKEALEGYDSARALKLLTISSKLLPWRSDVRNLRQIALETYIKVTNSMIETKKCEGLSDRISFF